MKALTSLISIAAVAILGAAGIHWLRADPQPLPQWSIPVGAIGEAQPTGFRPAAASSGEWASGRISTYLNDQGAFDNYVYYYVHFIPDSARRTARVDYILAMETPTSTWGHMWNKWCVGSTCKYTAQYLRSDQYKWVKTDFNVRMGISVSITVTNSSWDVTGIYGETWSGYVTLR